MIFPYLFNNTIPKEKAYWNPKIIPADVGLMFTPSKIYKINLLVSFIFISFPLSIFMIANLLTRFLFYLVSDG